MVDRRTFIGLAGMVGLSLAGCGTGNAVTQTTDSPQATEVEQTPSEKPAQPRFSAPATRGRSSCGEWDTEENGDPKFEVANLNEVSDSYSTTINGTVHNDYTKKTDIEVVVVLRDSSGAMVGGVTGYARDAAPGDDTAFSAHMYDIAPEHASVEGYANPIVPR
jgi:hypothetical protein